MSIQVEISWPPLLGSLVTESAVCDGVLPPVNEDPVRGLVVLHHAVPHGVPVSEDVDWSAGASTVKLEAGEGVVTAGQSDPRAQVEADPAWSIGPERVMVCHIQ